MTQHKFSVGQLVALRPSTQDGKVPRGQYRIERQLPSDTRDLLYRVRHVVDGHERVVVESQLALLRNEAA